MYNNRHNEVLLMQTMRKVHLTIVAQSQTPPLHGSHYFSAFLTACATHAKDVSLALKAHLGDLCQLVTEYLSREDLAAHLREQGNWSYKAFMEAWSWNLV